MFIFSSEDVGLGSNRWLDHVRHCKLLVDVIDGMCNYIYITTLVELDLTFFFAVYIGPLLW